MRRQTMSLRTHLTAIIAGDGPKPRGHALDHNTLGDTRTTHEAIANIARANWNRGTPPARIAAPSELLPPLP